MKVKDVVILNEVADDFNDGRSFFDTLEKVYCTLMHGLRIKP
jgi:hypothetical protein